MDGTCEESREGSMDLSNAGLDGSLEASMATKIDVLLKFGQFGRTEIASAMEGDDTEQRGISPAFRGW